MSEAAELLWREIERTNAFHAGPGTDAALAPKLQALATWQAGRLARTYADLRETPRYRPATEFFLSDLYGGKDFTRRDHDVERLYPVVVRVLSEHAIGTIALAMELNVMSHELDHRLVQALAERTGEIGRITVTSYAEAYRRCDNYAERKHQIALIRRIGEELDAVVAKPMIYAALKLGRKPAQLAGLDELQGFLERGFRAYRQMGGAKEFLDTIETREMLILDQIYAGKPDPFSVDQC